MRKLNLTLAIIMLCFISCKKEVKTEGATINERDSIKTEEPIVEEPIDSAAQMKAWAAYATPGDAHKLMAEEVGTWNCDMTFWSQPNGKAEKAASTANIQMVLGGRYQETSYQGNIMGQPFEGKSTLAYNNASEEYTTTFIDNMGTGMVVAMGKYDEKTKSIELKGEMVNPVNGKKTPYREVYNIIDSNTRKIEMYDVKNGSEYKSMEIVMTRK
ncbi:DUF1579 domain-containing protein [Flavobacterium sp. DGU38]|uniref:DUF1579 domain-containing protein n=1 Tax=Flavobacterium calami TaxID=3139144 RepID=A0ABU9ISX1_9FLAO